MIPIMTYLPEFLTVAVLHLLAVMSPGPDFAMITRNSLAYSRTSAIYSALGVALGILVHVSYSLIGVGLIISQSVQLFSLIKLLGAGYLIYIGYKSLGAKPHSVEAIDAPARHDLSVGAAVRTGFLTNVLNPKATLFFFSLFTQVIHASTPAIMKVVYGLEMSLVTFLWFALVATVLSHPHIKARFSAAQHTVEKIMGVVLIALGLKVALSQVK